MINNLHIRLLKLSKYLNFIVLNLLTANRETVNRENVMLQLRDYRKIYLFVYETCLTMNNYLNHNNLKVLFFKIIEL